MIDVEKKRYILSDCKRRIIIPIGTMPDDLALADEWWQRCFKASEDWFKRYETNSMFVYAKELWLDFMDENEEKYRRLISETGRYRESKKDICRG